jgi:hypothetical protein
MKFFKKADEMEMSINFKSMRISWVFENIALLIWTIIGFIKGDEFSYIPLIIIIVQNIVFFSSKLYMTSKMSVNSDEK